MSRYKNGNPKKQSRFICLNCLSENMIAVGLQRNFRQRENNHIKDLYCLGCRTVTKNLEVRYCDSFGDKMERAKILSKKYYNCKKREVIRMCRANGSKDNNINYNCSELIETLKYDIEEYGGNKFVTVLFRRYNGVVICIDYTIDIDIEDFDIRENDFCDVMSMTALMILLEKQKLIS